MTTPARRHPDLRAASRLDCPAPLKSSRDNLISRFLAWLMPERPQKPTIAEHRHRALTAKRKWQQARLHHECSRGLYEEYVRARAVQLNAELGR